MLITFNVVPICLSHSSCSRSTVASPDGKSIPIPRLSLYFRQNRAPPLSLDVYFEWLAPGQEMKCHNPMTEGLVSAWLMQTLLPRLSSLETSISVQNGESRWNRQCRANEDTILPHLVVIVWRSTIVESSSCNHFRNYGLRVTSSLTREVQADCPALTSWCSGED